MHRVVLFFLFFLTSTLSQAKPVMDSLQIVWQDHSQSDLNRAKAYRDYLFDKVLYVQPDSAYQFANALIDFGNDRNFPRSTFFGLKIQGISMWLQGDLSRAIALTSKALNIAESYGDKKDIASALNNLGTMHLDNDQALIALDYYLRSLKIAEETDDLESISFPLFNIANVYQSQGKTKIAMEYFERCLVVAEQFNNQHDIAFALSSIGSVYRDEGNLSKSMYHQERSLKLFEKINDQRGICSTLNYIGLIYTEQGNHKLALSYYFRALEIAEKVEDQYKLSQSQLYIGEEYNNKTESKKAVKWCENSYETSIEFDFTKNQQLACNCLYLAYKAQGNSNKALKYHELMFVLEDSMNIKGTSQKLQQMEFDKQVLSDSIATLEKARQIEEIHQREVRKKNRTSNILLGGGVFLLLMAGTIYARLRYTRKAKAIIEKQKTEVDNAYSQLGEKNKEILDSITYAKRIQSAILPPEKFIKEYLVDSFILYKPKDIVAGDFYWMEPLGETVYFAAADCTGHGVPGALVSVICNGGLNRSVREFGLIETGEILDKTRELVIQEFEKSEEDVNDGMDIALCALNGNTLSYSGANNPLWIIRHGEILETKADKQPIGKYVTNKAFVTHTIELQKGDSIYIFSDGYSDQFGGKAGKKYKPGKFKKFLLSIHGNSMNEQRDLLDREFENWKGNLEQLDDVCVIGVRI